jgi:hypothetical protein
MTASDAPQWPASDGAQASLEDLFAGVAPLQSADELASNGVFDDGEVEEFLTDLYAMRRADLA